MNYFEDRNEQSEKQLTRQAMSHLLLAGAGDLLQLNVIIQRVTRIMHTLKHPR